MSRLPTVFLPHGGGPCFFLKPGEIFPAGTWDRMAAYLRSVPDQIDIRPKALLIISAHWEEAVSTTYAPRETTLLYDYYGFPPSSYELKYPAAGDRVLAMRARDLLVEAGVTVANDRKRGFDHGVFIPMKVAYPDADIPIVQLSLIAGLDVQTHLDLGRALLPLRDEGVLIVGSGMSYHNIESFRTSVGNLAAQNFDTWLEDAVTASDARKRNLSLQQWSSAPDARAAHPREEHLAPLFVVAGAAGDDIGQRSYSDTVLGKAVSAFQFGATANVVTDKHAA